MQVTLLAILIMLGLMAWLDYYSFQATKTLLKNHNIKRYKYVRSVFVLQAIVLMGITVYLWLSQRGTTSFMFLAVVVFMAYLSKLIAVLFVFIDDIRRVIQYFFEGQKKRHIRRVENGQKISRSKFLAKSAVAVSMLPVVTMSFGIVKGAYDYRLRRRKVYLPNIPKGFDGLKIAQLSDIHSGSFFDKTAVQGGIDMLNAERPDLMFFTGDLVNNQTKEVNDYIDLFSKVKTDLGVYSTLGNHDYGDYMAWPSVSAKRQNLADMIKVHERMGWRLMMNENESIKVGTDQLSVIGVENWGAGRFAKYGQLDKATMNAEGDVKLLLSHDPSHWDAQVRSQHTDIDIMFAGHTHGMQLGVEIGDFRWSPSKYIYKQWADLYQEDQQYLYVNRGFGFLGFPGRIGILPEITIMELTSTPIS
jgi:predicted MPP superfamily phosphohydrolase